MARRIEIAGLSPEDILSLSDADLEEFVFCGEPVMFPIGSAEVLGEFRLAPDRLVLELATIDGGGEGVLPALSSLAHRYARSRGLHEVEWVVHAVRCANPNLKLRRVLTKLGFAIKPLDGVSVYHKIERLDVTEDG